MSELQEDERECPYCFEVIKKKAIVCRWCGRGLINTTDQPGPVTTDTIKSLTEKQKVLEQAVNERLKLGWILLSRTTEMAQMTAPKKFDWIMFMFWLVVSIITFGLPIILYAIYEIVKKPKLIVITVNDQLQVLVDGQLAPQATAPGGTLFDWSKTHGTLGQPNSSAQPVANVPTREQTPEEKEAAARSTRKVLLIIGAVIAGFIILSCICSFLSALGNNNVPAAFLPALSLLI